MKTTLLILLYLIIALTSCNNNDDGFTPTLPEITQIGANTFGCLINGGLLIPRNGTGTVLGSDNGMSFFGSGEGPNYDYNEIRVRDFKSDSKGIMKIHITELNSSDIGTYPIKESNCENGLDANDNINITLKWFDDWYCSIENSGFLIISRYDFENKIVSGTFSFSAVNRDNPNEIIEITEGRFDLKWDILNTTIIDFP